MFLGAFHDSRLLGGALNLFLGNTLFSMSLFSLDEYRKLRINHLLYWNRIELACERGLQRLDLGRSGIGSGPYKFKMSWKGVEVPIYQQFWLNRTRNIPLLADDADSGNGRLFTRIWQRVPLPITRLVGPTIRRELPFV